jgi:hypothetical protein
VTVKPRVTLIFNNGEKMKVEMYDRPPSNEIVYFRFIGIDGAKIEVPFTRFGPDEYKQISKEQEIDMMAMDREKSIERIKA